ETKRRRAIQMEHNKKYGITPKTVIKGIREVIQATKISNDEVSKKKVNINIPKILMSV
ncbi:excinuclease ABC, B subunit, partial [Candidatus Arthromitus sp. SFB-2]